MLNLKSYRFPQNSRPSLSPTSRTGPIRSSPCSLPDVLLLQQMMPHLLTTSSMSSGFVTSRVLHVAVVLEVTAVPGAFTFPSNTGFAKVIGPELEDRDDFAQTYICYLLDSIQSRELQFQVDRLGHLQHHGIYQRNCTEWRGSILQVLSLDNSSF